MIHPLDLQSDLPIVVGNKMKSTTTKVWEMLLASRNGQLDIVKSLAAQCPGLLYAQYNYTPPIHFAVREGHTELVRFFLGQGAYDSGYRFYPFQESLETVADDRGYLDIVQLLEQYGGDPSLQKFRGDNGEIEFNRTTLELEFEKAVYQENINSVREILEGHAEFATDESYFWGEGILLFAVKENNRELIDLLWSYGARVPDILKWAQFYYFEHLDNAIYIMEKGMNPDTMSWQHVTLLHDMAQKGFIDKAELLVKYGADINPIDEAYQSTPLGMAARWGNTEMVEFLLACGADPQKAGAAWATPLAWARKKENAIIAEIVMKAGAQN